MKRNYIIIFFYLLLPFFVIGQNKNRVRPHEVSTNTSSSSSSSSAKVVSQGVFFYEDFSAGTIPADWTQKDNTGSGLLWKWTTSGSANGYGSLDTAGTSAENGFLIIDSDAQNANTGGENTDLISSAIDASGHSAVRLSFNQFFVQFFESKGAVYVSSDSINWTQVYQVGSGLTNDQSPGNPHNVNVDISLIAANQPKVFLRFNWQGDYEYFWQIDDIQMYEPAPKDAGVLSVVVSQDSTSLCSISESVPISMLIKNYGSDTISNFNVVYKINGGNSITETVTNTLAPDDTLNYLFSSPAEIATAGTFLFTAFTQLSGDTVPSNDSAMTTADFVISSDLSQPLTMSFEKNESLLGWNLGLNPDNDLYTWELWFNDLYAHMGDYSFSFWTPGGNDVEDWFFTKCLRLKKNHKYQLNYYYTAVGDWNNSNFGVYIGSNQTIAAMTQTIKTDSIIEGISRDYTLESKTFFVPENGNYFIGFKIQEGPEFKSTAIVIDDITITNLGYFIGINDLENNPISIYPNPATQTLMIEAGTESGTLSIYTILGELVHSSDLLNGVNTVSLYNLSQGSYTIKLMLKNDNVVTRKFVKME